MKNKIVLLVISCLFLAMAGCNSNKAGQAVTLPQQATGQQRAGC